MTFKPLKCLRCMSVGHNYVNSHSRPGYLTCQRCGLRKKG